MSRRPSCSPSRAAGGRCAARRRRCAVAGAPARRTGRPGAWEPSVAAHGGQLEAEQVERGDLRGEGLGRGHADLDPRAGEQRGVRVARGLRAGDVGDRQHGGALIGGQAHGRQRVRGLARLVMATTERPSGITGSR